MRVLHLAAGNRWTGAAAPAFAEVEALRSAGVEAHYAYVGGYKLEKKLESHAFAHPVIAKAQNPVSFLRTVSSIQQLIADHDIDLLHTHLTYDHWLARFVARGRPGLRIARTFHSRRTLRNEPFTRALLARTDLICVINEDLRDAPLLRKCEVTVTPPPLDTAQFKLEGPDLRALYNIASDVPVVTAIGKLSKGRGFEAVLETFARVRRTMGRAKLIIIGHGEHRPALESAVRALAIEDAVIWAGYHEDDLAEHYRTANVLLFTAAGSDEGHRAVLEAMGCGVAPAAYPIEGMRGLLGSLAPQHIATSESPDALASVVVALLNRDREKLRDEVRSRANAFDYRTASSRLIDAYSTVL